MTANVRTLLAAAALTVLSIAPRASGQAPRELAGTVGDGLEVVMSLKQDGERVTGKYRYTRRAGALTLYGERSGRRVVLREFDAGGRPTGEFRGLTFAC